MPREQTYRCLGCLDGTVVRSFDVSHVSVTCPACGSFERLLNDDVFAKYREFEESPPETLEWSRLSRMEKLYVSDQVVRFGRSIEDFEIEA